MCEDPKRSKVPNNLFPFEYRGGGYFRLKGVPKGVDAEILHGMQAVEYLYEQMNKKENE